MTAGTEVVATGTDLHHRNIFAAAAVTTGTSRRPWRALQDLIDDRGVHSRIIPSSHHTNRSVAAVRFISAHLVAVPCDDVGDLPPNLEPFATSAAVVPRIDPNAVRPLVQPRIAPHLYHSRLR